MMRLGFRDVPYAIRLGDAKISPRLHTLYMDLQGPRSSVNTPG